MVKRDLRWDLLNQFQHWGMRLDSIPPLGVCICLNLEVENPPFRDSFPLKNESEHKFWNHFQLTTPAFPLPDCGKLHIFLALHPIPSHPINGPSSKPSCTGWLIRMQRTVFGSTSKSRPIHTCFAAQPAQNSQLAMNFPSRRGLSFVLAADF